MRRRSSNGWRILSVLGFFLALGYASATEERFTGHSPMDYSFWKIQEGSSSRRSNTPTRLVPTTSLNIYICPSFGSCFKGEGFKSAQLKSVNGMTVLLLSQSELPSENPSWMYSTANLLYTFSTENKEVVWEF